VAQPAVTALALVALVVAAGNASPLKKPLVDKPLAELSETTTPLLGGRLTVRLPVGAKIEARGHGIMSAGESSVAETRAMMDLEGARWVLFAQELYLLAGTDPVADAAKLISKWPEVSNLSLAPFPVGGLKAVLVAQKTLGFGEDANLLRGAYVVSADGTLQFVGCYLNPGGKKEGARWADECVAVLKTLAPGAAKLASTAGERTLGTDGLVLTAPEGVVMRTQEGPDFAVYRFEVLGRVDAPHSGCGVYVGSHAAWQWKQQDVPEAKVKKSSDTFLGAKAEWSSWSLDARTTVEVLGKHPRGYAVHGFCSSGDEGELTKLRGMLATLKPVK
jgi:hypothetical protein